MFPWVCKYIYIYIWYSFFSKWPRERKLRGNKRNKSWGIIHLLEIAK